MSTKKRPGDSSGSSGALRRDVRLRDGHLEGLLRPARHGPGRDAAPPVQPGPAAFAAAYR